MKFLTQLPERVRARLFLNESVRRTLRPFVRVPRNRQWVFVIGCYNSGTTLLHDLIARSRGCASLPAEGVFGTDQLIAPEELGWPRLWWKVQDKMLEFGEGGAKDAEILKRDWCLWLDTKRPVFLEKSVSNVLRVTWLDKNFPGAHFVEIIRNGYAVAEGIRRRAGRGQYPLPSGLSSYPIEWCAQQWVSTLEAARAQLSEVDGSRVLTIRYEDLCKDPYQVLPKAERLTGLHDLTEYPLDHVRNRNEQAISQLSTEDVRTINDVAGETLTTYRYALL